MNIPTCSGSSWRTGARVGGGMLPVMLVNATAARNIRVEKPTFSDASWLAQFGAHGLLRPCFVPPPPIHILRDLTRARTVATQDRTSEVQRLEKFLESTDLKLPDNVSDLMGVSSWAMLTAFICTMHLERIDSFTGWVEQITEAPGLVRPDVDFWQGINIRILTPFNDKCRYTDFYPTNLGERLFSVKGQSGETVHPS